MDGACHGRPNGAGTGPKNTPKRTVDRLLTNAARPTQKPESTPGQRTAGGTDRKYYTNWQAEDQPSACQWLCFGVST